MTDATLPIVLLTDFGLTDNFVGICHGVIARSAPDANVIDLTHGIEPQNVHEGSLILRSAMPYMPIAVFVGVVDPGVGTDRRSIALACDDGSFFVGPDNGLLIAAAEERGAITGAVIIDSPDVILQPVSATFHGRDVFSPAAADLAQHGDLARLGSALRPTQLKRLTFPAPEGISGGLRTTVSTIDRFGNAALWLQGEEFVALAEGATRVELRAGRQRAFASVGSTFGDVRHGEPLVYVDSCGMLSIAVNHGSAAEALALRTGTSVDIVLSIG